MPLTYEPRAAPWEHLLVEKIFQKGGSGVSGIARWLQRHVRATDYTPPGTILRTDFRRSVAELNIDVSPEDFAAVAECCAYDGDHAGEPGSLLGVRHIANPPVDLAAAGSDQASVFGQNESSPLADNALRRACMRMDWVEAAGLVASVESASAEVLAKRQAQRADLTAFKDELRFADELPVETKHHADLPLEDNGKKVSPTPRKIVWKRSHTKRWTTDLPQARRLEVRRDGRR